MAPADKGELSAKAELMSSQPEALFRGEAEAEADSRAEAMLPQAHQGWHVLASSSYACSAASTDASTDLDSEELNRLAVMQQELQEALRRASAAEHGKQELQEKYVEAVNTAASLSQRYQHLSQYLAAAMHQAHQQQKEVLQASRKCANLNPITEADELERHWDGDNRGGSAMDLAGPHQGQDTPLDLSDELGLLPPGFDPELNDLLHELLFVKHEDHAGGSASRDRTWDAWLRGRRWGQSSDAGSADSTASSAYSVVGATWDLVKTALASGLHTASSVLSSNSPSTTVVASGLLVLALSYAVSHRKKPRLPHYLLQSLP